MGSFVRSLAKGKDLNCPELGSTFTVFMLSRALVDFDRLRVGIRKFVLEWSAAICAAALSKSKFSLSLIAEGCPEGISF
jgi:hypothetical protein